MNRINDHKKIDKPSLTGTPYKITHAVPSGSFVVSNRKPERLTAYLGSCVGVTLWDPVAQLGGLIHLLLPEPAGSNTSFQPETYAATGLPLMIKELAQKGASPDRLEARMAGGALVGPVSADDLTLDIGGRTVEIAEQILSREKIKIIQVETGGFFACSLTLDLSNGQGRIEPIGLPPAQTVLAFAKPDRRQIEIAMDQVQPIPQMALKILRMVADQNYRFQDIAKEVRQDQIISAKIISLCGSAFYGRKMNIDSIDRALLLLGEKQFLQLVISASLERFFPVQSHGYSLCKGGLFRHALGTALVAERLAQLIKKGTPDLAYTAGLLHDIGKVVLDQYMAPAYPLFYRRTQLEGEDFIEVEKEEFGFTHADIGVRLGERWSLPSNLIETIQWHHRPDQAQIHPELVHIVNLADTIMSRYVTGQELERINPGILKQSLKFLAISDDYLPILIDNLPRQIFASN
ncbi:MAG: HDOD domain-containing protein [Desulfobacteraceae bacterium]|nr:MAG: HDOD domain-containing protein [Desulfobacteraceae bacterium]